MRTLFKLAAVAVFVTFSSGSTAFALAVDCSLSNVDSGVTPNSDCFVGETFVGAGGMSGNDAASTLNNDFVFERNNWEQKLRENNLASPTNTSLITFTSSGLLGGVFTLAPSLFSDYGKVAAVLKAGNTNNGGWVAYLLEATGPYTYATVFGDAFGNNNAKDLSHLTIYGSLGAVLPDPPDPFIPVPLPSSVWLLLAGVGGIGLMARRRKA